MLRDLGPLPGDKLDHTIWDMNTWTPEEQAWWKTQNRTYQRVVRDVVGTPILASELEVGDLVNAEPEIVFATTPNGQPIVEGTDLLVAKSKAAVILSRMDPEDIVSTQTKNWSVDGIVCYSKICTHVGCPISLNERTTHHLLCPCHQSTFDLTDSGKVLFGPAARPLPQLRHHRGRRRLPRRQTRLRRARRTEFLGARLTMSLDTSKIANTNSSEPAVASKPSKAGAAATWADDRLGLATLMRKNLRKVFPDHWSFMLGEIALWSFVVLLLTGVFLTFWFVPSMSESTYQGTYAQLRGVPMSDAYASTLHISFDVRGGLLMRQMHHWAAMIFIAAMLVHMMRVFLTGAFRKPRELNWVIGSLLVLLGILEGFAGYSLPDDLLSGTGLRIADGLVKATPGGRHLHVVLHVRRGVPGRRDHPAALHGPHPADPGAAAGPDRRAHAAAGLPQAHAVGRARAGPSRTSSATRCCRSTWPRRAASSSWSSASPR